MEKVIDITSKQNYTQLAVDKIAEELKTFKGDRYGNAVKKHVASTIIHFCEQEPRFAEVVYKTKRTLSDCCAEIMKGCGSSISDIDVYRGAVRHYFPNSEVEFHMTIRLTGAAPSDEEMSLEPTRPKQKSKYNFFFDDSPESDTDIPEQEKSNPEKPKKVAQPPKAPAKPKKEPKAPEVIQLTLF